MHEKLDIQLKSDFDQKFASKCDLKKSEFAHESEFEQDFQDFESRNFLNSYFYVWGTKFFFWVVF